MHLASVLPCLNKLSWVSDVWAVVSSVTVSVMGMRRILGITAPGSAHCSKHRCFILSFSEIYRWAAWLLGAITTTTLVDRAGRIVLPARREDTKKCNPHKRCSDIATVWKRWLGFIHRSGIFSTFQLKMSGRRCRERKEKQEGRGRPAALLGSHLRFCSGRNGCQPLLLGLLWISWEEPHHHSFLFPSAGGTYRQHILRSKKATWNHNSVSCWSKDMSSPEEKDHLPLEPPFRFMPVTSNNLFLIFFFFTQNNTK